MKNILDSLVAKYNTPDFIADDPVQFPRMFTGQADIEITALLISNIAWGKRSMILRNARKIINLMNGEPLNFIMDKAYESLDVEQNIHRTFFGRHLKYFLKGLNRIYNQYDTIEDFAYANNIANSDAPAWDLAKLLSIELKIANESSKEPLQGPDRCFPSDTDKAALKRFNMALRWLVRQDGIVDIGCWSVLKPSRLYIPLDVHVANTSRQFGLLQRKQNDRRAVEELTATLRAYNPDDPTIYDFALFGLGVNAESHAIGD